MKKRILKKSYILILLIILILSIAMLYIKRYNIEKNLIILLNGDKKIELNYNEKYNDSGAIASYKKIDLTPYITIENNIDSKKLGKYKVKYKIEYKNVTKEIERVVKIVDKTPPAIKLNENENITLYVGNKYIEYGATAKDDYDGNITDRITINGNVDTTKKGNYHIEYTVKDSNNNVGTMTRNIEVKEKTIDQINQRIAVLNYHFFYKDWSEECHEIICENIKTFEKQLQYLKDNNFKTLTIKEFVEWMYGEIEIPKKSVLITIDDGAHGTGKHNGNHLIPLLEKYDMHATLFLITGWWDIKNYISDNLDIESHTNNLHNEATCGYRSKVNCVKYADLVNDLKKSIEVTKTNNAFCFPFYEYTEESLKAVKEVGFKVAFVGGERKANRSGDKYKIPRYVIQDDTTMESFISYVN